MIEVRRFFSMKGRSVLLKSNHLGVNGRQHKNGISKSKFDFFLNIDKITMDKMKTI